MAEMYDTTTTCCSSSSPHHTTTGTTASRPPVLESDEISVFLHHLLHPSSSSSSSFISQRSKQMPFLSSSSSSSFPPLPPPLPPQFKSLLSSDDHHHHHHQQQQQQIQHRPSCMSTLVHESSDYRVIRDRTSTAESSAAAAALVDSSNLILSSSGFYFPSEVKDSDFGAGDSDAVGGSVKRRKFPVENDLDDYDCESEEGLEASDGPSKPAPSSRSSSKRSRAAEVHNLSEKRRRSRINEKMKALQNLIPNSNKTDKASMLDEAIEYLKQLQLQVQMLSMRNGLSLHPLYLPGAVQPLQLPQMRMGFSEGSGLPPTHINMGTATVPLNQESSTQTPFGLSNQSTTLHQPMALTHPETSFGLELPIPINHGQFQLSSRELYREGGLPQQQLHTSSSARNSSAMAAATRPFDTRSSVLENTEHMETCLRRTRLQDMPPKDVDNQNLIQHLQSLQTGTSVMSHSGKIKTGDF